MSEANILGQVRRVECASCGGDRNCQVRAHFSEKGNDAEYYYWSRDWNVMQCLGCDYVFLETVSTNSEDVDYVVVAEGETIEEYTETRRYWPAIAGRKFPDWISGEGVHAETPTVLDAALLELYGALNSDLRMLAAIGIRTCFDICAENLGVKSELRFTDKLDELVNQNHIRAKERDALEVLVEGGSASAHRGWQPTAVEISTMMDILEQFVFDTYVAPSRRKQLQEQADTLRPNVPKRRQSEKKAAASALAIVAATASPSVQVESPKMPT